MIRLSIIIPFYNVERFISQCLDSVFNQNVPQEEYEVICVNDGSPDHSKEIVEEYMLRHTNLHLVEHDHNRKLGTARNTGRSVANGNYIWNVDSDDKIAENCLGTILNICEKNDLDLLEIRPKKFNENGIYDLPSAKPAYSIMSGLDYMESRTSHEVSQMSSVWRRIILRSLLEDNNIYSPEVNMGEDVPYSFKVLMHSKRMLVLPETCYYYRSNPDSLTGDRWVPTPPVLYEKCLQNSRMIYDVAQEVPIAYPKVKKAFTDAAKYSLTRYAYFMSLMPLDAQRQFRTLCRTSFRSDGYIRNLLPKKRYVSYLAWLSGIINTPK